MKKLLILLFLAPFFSLAQKIENLKAAAQGEKIVITYDLVEGNPGDTYIISLFASSNNFVTPLHRVSGDVGKGIIEGRVKKIEWESRAELGNFKGQLSFEIHVEVVAAFALLTNPVSVKRGKSQLIQWRGGDKHESVDIELVQAGTVVTKIGTVENTGRTEWAVPPKQALGEYQLRMTNSTETINSQPFAIKRKIPTLVKVLPLVAIGAVAVVLAGGSKGETTPPRDPPLATPPDILD